MELLISHRRQWFQQKRLVLFVAAAFFSYRAMAQETTGGQRWFDQDAMTGNWGGVRSSLRDAGIDLRAHFTTESAGNSSGGTGEPFEQHDGRWGGYIMVDQMVFREESSSNRGLTLGAMATVGDPDTAKYSYFWVTGGHYQSTFPRRDNDVVSFLVAYARTNFSFTQY